MNSSAQNRLMAEVGIAIACANAVAHGGTTPPFQFSLCPKSPIICSMDKSPDDPAEALLHTYSADGGINYLDAAATLPSRPAIDDACVELLSLLFPGFRGEPVVRPGDLPDLTRSRIRAL